MNLEDDTFPDTLNEGQTYDLNVFANDSICCKPIIAEIVTFNSLFVSSATIDASSGIITVDMQAELPTATNANLLTYRVTCPNGSYDEASVFANVSGTAVECLSPINLQIISITDSYAQATWDAPTPAPVAYRWELYLASDLLTPILTGDIIDLYADLDSLTPSTEYRFYVRSTCVDDISEFIYINFTTNPASESETCGQYLIENWDLSAPHFVTYIDCIGVSQDSFIAPGAYTYICAMQNGPGDPIQITPSHFDINITYVDLC